jgi:hypothetical protein
MNLPITRERVRAGRYDVRLGETVIGKIVRAAWARRWVYRPRLPPARNTMKLAFECDAMNHARWLVESGTLNPDGTWKGA